MRKQFSIGEISKITGFTINALRHYDKIGLCKPAIVNQETNYRYYDESQLFIFDIIKFARKIDLSLEELSDIINSKQMTTFKDFLETLKVRMSQQIEQLTSNISNIELIQDRVNTSEYLVTIKSLYQREIPSRSVVVSQDLPSSINNYYTKQRELLENEILSGGMTPIFDTGNMYRLGRKGFEHVGIYKAVNIDYNADSDRIMSLPGGNYLCINYHQDAKEEAWEQMLNGIGQFHLENPIIIESLLLNEIYDQDQASYELQVYIGDEQI